MTRSKTSHYHISDRILLVWVLLTRSKTSQYHISDKILLVWSLNDKVKDEPLSYLRQDSTCLKSWWQGQRRTIVISQTAYYLFEVLVTRSKTSQCHISDRILLVWSLNGKVKDGPLSYLRLLLWSSHNQIKDGPLPNLRQVPCMKSLKWHGQRWAIITPQTGYLWEFVMTRSKMGHYHISDRLLVWSLNGKVILCFFITCTNRSQLFSVSHHNSRRCSNADQTCQA